MKSGHLDWGGGTGAGHSQHSDHVAMGKSASGAHVRMVERFSGQRNGARSTIISSYSPQSEILPVVRRCGYETFS